MSDQILSPTSIHPALSATSPSNPSAALPPVPTQKADGFKNNTSSTSASASNSASQSQSHPHSRTHTYTQLHTYTQRPRTSSYSAPGPTVAAGLSSASKSSTNPPSCLSPSVPLPLSLQHLSLDEAKQSLRHVDHVQPVSLAAALVGGPTDSPDPIPYCEGPGQGDRRNSRTLETVPRQTLIKALASSVARNNKPEALSLPGMLTASATAASGAGADADDAQPGSSSSQLCNALNDLAHRNSTGPVTVNGPSLTPTTALPALQSPCFYHQRFDGIVDIDKVLEEIKNDEWMSHSRLVQTATGVREVSKQLQRRPIKRAVRNVMIVTKARDNQLVLLTRELAQWLLRTSRYGSDLGVNVFVDAKLRNSKRFNAAGLVEENPRFQHMLKYWTPDLCWSQPEKFDLVLTLGGDGTVLFTSWLFQRIVPPVLSFSLGSLGFLTSFEYERFRQHLNRVMGDDGMKINLRMRFTCTVYRDGMMGREMEEGEQFEVLNELVIDRGPSPYVSNLELYGDNELLTVVQADGCIFSTPTGKHTHCRSGSTECLLTRSCRINSLLPLRRRLPRAPRHPRDPSHAHLPAHALLPANGPLRHDAPAGVGAAQQPRDGVLRLRRQGPGGAEAGRLRDHHRVPVPLPHGDAHRHGMVRLRVAHAAVEHARRDPEGLGRGRLRHARQRVRGRGRRLGHRHRQRVLRERGGQRGREPAAEADESFGHLNWRDG